MRFLLWFLLVPVAVSSAAAQTATYTIVPEESMLAYTGRHVMHSWTGENTKVSGSIVLDPASPGTARVTLSAPVEAFDSGNSNRDSNMLDVVNVDRYPVVRFVSQSVQPVRWEKNGAGFAGEWLVRGTLTFHGQERPVEIPVKVSLSGSAIDAEGAFTVLLSDFKVKRPKLLFKAIEDDIQLTGAFRATR